MRIRKRSASVVTTTPQQPLPISYKYQTTTVVSASSREGSKLVLAPECSNMQETRRLDGVEDHEAQVSRSDLNEETPGVREIV